MFKTICALLMISTIACPTVTFMPIKDGDVKKLTIASPKSEHKSPSRDRHELTTPPKK